MNELKAHLKVSVLVPSFNHCLYIAETIESIWSQDYPNLQLIVVDDGSTDASFDIISYMASHSPIEMLIHRQSNQGLCKTLNKALELANGDIISVLASDDIMLPGRFNNELYLFSINKELKVLYSNGCYSLNGKIHKDIHKFIKKLLKMGIKPTLDYLVTNVPSFYIQAMLIRRNFLESIGNFDEETGSDDWALNIRVFQSLKSSHEYLYFENNAFMYRLHPEQNHRIGLIISPMIKRVVRKYFSVEARAHLFCNVYLKRIITCFLSGNFKRGINYIQKVLFVSCTNGFPIFCITNKIIRIPSIIIRKYINTNNF
jgi:alpha-1,3-rhamnosyltransferase